MVVGEEGQALDTLASGSLRTCRTWASAFEASLELKRQNVNNYSGTQPYLGVLVFRYYGYESIFSFFGRKVKFRKDTL